MNRLGFFSTRRRDDTMPLIYSSTGSKTSTSASGVIYIINGSPNQSITIDFILDAFGVGGQESLSSINSLQISENAVSTIGLVSTVGTQIITLNTQGSHEINWTGYNAIDGGYFSISLSSTQASGGAYIYNP